MTIYTWESELFSNLRCFIVTHKALSITAVEDEGALRRAKVSHILSVTMRQAPYPHGVDVNTKKIEVEDDPSVVS